MVLRTVRSGGPSTALPTLRKDEAGATLMTELTELEARLLRQLVNGGAGSALFYPPFTGMADPMQRRGLLKNIHPAGHVMAGEITDAGRQALAAHEQRDANDNLVQVSDDAVVLAPTAGLRFIERGGQRVLQQKWSGTATEGTLTQFRWVWRDVPLERDPSTDSPDAPVPPA